MALAEYTKTFWFPDGSVAANIAARVFPENSSALAPLWTDATGTVPLPNPLNTTASGVLSFWAEEGTYWIHIDTESFAVLVPPGAPGPYLPLAGGTLTGPLELTAGGIDVDAQQAIGSSLSTGVLSGGVLSASATPASVDFTAMNGYVVDYVTDENNPVVTEVTTLAQTIALDAAALLRTVTWWMVDSAGVFTQQEPRPSNAQRRTHIVLGVTAQAAGVVFVAQSVQTILPQLNNQFGDLLESLGAFNVSGNIVTANGANRMIDQSAGVLFSRSFDRALDPADPHLWATVSQAPAQWRYSLRNTVVFPPNVTLIDPTMYDNNGVLTAVGGGANTSTVQQIWIFPSNTVNGQMAVQYGQTTYGSLSAAVAAIGKGAFTPNPQFTGAGPVVMYLAVTRTATNLSDPTQATFVMASKLGAATTGATEFLSQDGVIQVNAPTGVAATDQAAINTAVASLPVTGGVVQLQAGTYVLPAPASPADGCVSMNVNNSVLAGQGMGVTTLQVAAGTTADITGIIRTPGGVSNSRITFRDLSIDGNKTNVVGAPAIIGAFCGVTPNSTATDTDIVFSNIEIRNCTEYGFDPHERTTRLRITDCIAHDNDLDGFALDAIYDGLVQGCVSYSNARHGFNLVTASTRVRMADCHAYSNGSNGFTAQAGAKYVTFTGCTANGSTGAGFVFNGVPQAGQQDNTPGGVHVVDGCTASLSGTHGFQLVGCSHNTFTGCRSQDASQAATNTSDHYRVAESGAVFSVSNSLTGCTWGQTSGVVNAAKYGVEEQTGNDGPTYTVACSGAGTATGTLNLLNATSLLAAAHNGAVNSHAIGVYSQDLPSLHGYREWNWPPDLSGASAGTAMIAGTIYGLRVDAQSGLLISTITVNIASAGTSMTAGQCFASVIDGTTGAELARTADLATVFQGSGITALSLVTPFTPTTGQRLGVMLLGNTAGTMPLLVRSSSTSATGPNAGLTSASPRRYFTAGTAQTSMPVGFTMASTTATGALTFWCALS